MKKLLLSAAMLCSLGVFAQSTVTNKTGSNYKFSVINDANATGIQNQGRTGTCWSFSGLSFFESEVLRKDKNKSVDLSEMFVVRRMYPMKAANYVRMHGKSNFAEGGGFPDDLLCLREFGMVPQSVYDGNRDKVYNHAEMVSVLEGMVKPLGEAKHLNPSWTKAIEGTLDAYMGDAPKTFEYNGKQYTPQSFAQYLGIDPNDYVIISSFNHHPFYSKFVLEVPDNWNWEKVYNVPIDEFVKIAEDAVTDGYTLAWAADVSEKGFNYRDGLAIVPEKDFSDMTEAERKDAFINPVKEKKITQEMRQEAFDNYETQDDHGMHITGIVKDQNGDLFFKVKNSWGETNDCGGYFYASVPYFAYKTTCFMVNKKAIPAAIAKKMGIK
ncbi:aminopeptidase [Chitinophaga caeni]|uniref:Aminopeptidase n=1 Tax=Chitinophaga caeni TaxID=2029983 RepID=A0A291QRT6_9BACT|nr:C1 family peptidase [Chitinophaga caeni]ATL46657.1 aminopeptidase [Chitinophaga caeni]